jgi:hypothetical protein
VILDASLLSSSHRKVQVKHTYHNIIDLDDEDIIDGMKKFEESD